jgi:hypothetical protein
MVFLVGFLWLLYRRNLVKGMFAISEAEISEETIVIWGGNNALIDPAGYLLQKGVRAKGSVIASVYSGSVFSELHVFTYFPFILEVASRPKYSWHLLIGTLLCVY